MLYEKLEAEVVSFADSNIITRSSKHDDGPFYEANVEEPAVNVEVPATGES